MIRTQVTPCVLLLGLAARADAITADELVAKNLEAKGGVAALEYLGTEDIDGTAAHKLRLTGT